MSTALIAARLLLAVVFAVSAVAKLADLQGSRRAVREFGLPQRLAAPVGVLLPVGELAVAAALLPASSAWWGGVGALALLSLFVAVMVVAVVRGRELDCHCFGQLHSSRVGRSSVSRTAAMAGVAAFVVVAGWGDSGPSAIGWLPGLSPAVMVAVVIGVLVVAALSFQTWFSLGLLRQNGRLLTRLEAIETALGLTLSPPTTAEAVRNGLEWATADGLAVGTSAPDFALPGLDGQVVGLNALRARGQAVLLVFSDPGCGPCSALAPEIAVWQQQRSAALTTVVVSRGSIAENKAKWEAVGVVNVLLQQDREVAVAYQAHATPSAVLLSGAGQIASPLAPGPDAIRALVELATRPPGLPLVAGDGRRANGHAGNRRLDGAPGRVGGQAPPSGLALGESAPALDLLGLAGERVRLSDQHGQVVLVIFWNTGCGFCQSMLEQLKQWDREPAAHAPKLFVISTAAEAETAAMGLTSTIVLDPGFSAGRMFGAMGTPSAVLIDADGRVASSLATGAKAISELMAPQPVGTLDA